MSTQLCETSWWPVIRLTAWCNLQWKAISNKAKRIYKNEKFSKRCKIKWPEAGLASRGQSHLKTLESHRQVRLYQWAKSWRSSILRKVKSTKSQTNNPIHILIRLEFKLAIRLINTNKGDYRDNLKAEMISLTVKMVLEFQLNVAPMIKMFPALENSRAWAMMTMSKDKISKKTWNRFTDSVWLDRSSKTSPKSSKLSQN